MIDKLDTFHKTRLGYLIFGLVELGLSYLISLKAIDNGNLILWVLAFILLFGFLQNLVRLLAISLSRVTKH